MRKILAALMAVMMVVSLLAVLPAGAALDPVRTSEFDGTRSNQTFDLIVTEYSSNTTITNATSSSVSGSEDCYQFIEIYNNGSNPVNLYEISILQISDAVGNSVWKNQKNFKETGLQLKLGAGSIYDSVDGMTAAKKNEQNVTNYSAVENPTTAMLRPGEIAVIWFWNKASASVSKAQKESLATEVDGRANFSKFRDHYAAVSNIDKFESDGETITDAWQNLEDTLIVAVCANTSVSSSLFDLSVSSGAMFAIANKDFQLNAGVNQGGNHVYCYFSTSINGRHGISSTAPDLTTIYVPPMTSPDLYNAIAKMESENPENYVPATDYLDWSANNAYGYKGVGCSLSYLELGMMSFQELPSIGAMNSYQWMYINAERMESLVEEERFGMIADWNDPTMAGIQKAEGNALTLQDNWTEICLEAMLAAKVQEPEEEVNRTETEREEDSMLKDQNFWEEQKGSNTQKNNNDEGGLSPLVLVLIIVGGVVVVGGAAVAVILILKKKNKPVALDDVASEEAVEVIDEQSSEE